MAWNAVSTTTVAAPQRRLRQLIRARREGAAYGDQEFVLGNACVAAPVFDPNVTPWRRFQSADHASACAEQRAPMVRRAADNITSRISSQAQDQWR